MTLHALSALNTNAYATQICARPPGVPDDARLFTYNFASNSFTSDSDPVALRQSVYNADLILKYNPLAPPSSAKLFPISMGVSCPTRVAISTEVHAELSEIVEQTCKVAALEGTARQYVGQHVGTTPIVLGRNNPQFEARVRKLLGVEKIPEPSPAEPAEARLRQIGDSLVDFGKGAVAEVPLTFVPGGSIGADLAIQGKLLPEGTRAARIGRGVVDFGVGVGQIIVGCGGTIGGIGLSGTGGGAIAGVPMTVGSLTLVVTGFANAGIGVRRLTIEILRRDDGPASSSGPPPQTTPPAQASPPAAKPPQQPPSVAKPAQASVLVKNLTSTQASRGVSAETTTTTRNKATGKTTTKRASGTTTATWAKPPPNGNHAKPVATTNGHHPWPKYLGGPAKQDLAKLPESLHKSYHSGLDKILPRQRGTAYYDNLGPQAKQQLIHDLAAYTKAFDAKYGTRLYDSMVSNGFPTP
jgi:hypothetical protein